MNTAKVYSKKEEIFNAISHGVGSLTAVVGTTVMITISAIYYNVVAVVSSAIYGFSMIAMFTMSTLYHAIPFPKAKRILQILDHDSIYLLIAGTYTPITLIALMDSFRGTFIFVVVWIAAIIGVILNAINMNKFKKASLLLYIIMGWAVVWDFAAVSHALGSGGFALLLAGGLCYTIGIIFYKMKKVSFMHGIWHLFVFSGSILHYLCILLHVLPQS
jgi:channel protein, hemolysin III family